MPVFASSIGAFALLPSYSAFARLKIMNKAIGVIFSILVFTLSPISLALADDDDHMPHPERVFVDVSVASPGVGKHGLAEFRLIHIVEEGGMQLFEDGKTYFAYKKANDNMLALATWSVTHGQTLTVELDPNAVGEKAIIYQMFLAGPLE